MSSRHFIDLSDSPFYLENYPEDAKLNGYEIPSKRRTIPKRVIYAILFALLITVVITIYYLNNNSKKKTNKTVFINKEIPEIDNTEDEGPIVDIGEVFCEYYLKQTDNMKEPVIISEDDLDQDIKPPMITDNIGEDLAKTLSELVQEHHSSDQWTLDDEGIDSESWDAFIADLDDGKEFIVGFTDEPMSEMFFDYRELMGEDITN